MKPREVSGRDFTSSMYFFGRINVLEEWGTSGMVYGVSGY
jgi:hypothetical protein